ncbi:hypothetical protein N0575_27565 [Pseudomonas aeruginosa]|nr:hypothetical protein [Pseudomonas aeruginosa]MCT1213479.1 hypothetical protein [Pseudomonas aeruginosa]
MSFNNTSRMSAKAGLQKWISMNEPGPMLVTGNEEFKKNLWLEFKLMNLEAKGYTLSGFEPKKEDLELLEKIKADYNKLKENKKQEIIENLIKDKPVETVIKDKPIEAANKEKPIETVIKDKTVDIVKNDEFIRNEELKKELYKFIPEKTEVEEYEIEQPTRRRNKFKI